MDPLATAIIIATWLVIIFVMFAFITMRSRAALATAGRITAHETAIAFLVAAMLSASAIGLAYLLLINR